MKKLAVLAVAAAGLLALAATAQAKEIVGFKICGASGCAESSAHVAIDQSTTATAVQPGAFYQVELRFGDGETVIHRENAYWLPNSGFMRFTSDKNGAWWKPDDVSGLQTAAAGVEPFVPKLDRVTVGGKSVADPSSYLVLLGTFKPALLPRGKLHMTRIIFRASTTNPWVDKLAAVGYDATRRLLVRSDGYYRIPATLGKLVMQRASLKATVSGTGGGHTALYAGLGVGGGVALAVLAVARRKRIH